MKRVLILGRVISTFDKLPEQIGGDDVEIDLASYDDLAFLVDGDDTKIFVYTTGQELKNYEKILVLSTSPYHRRNYIFSALACYCKKHHIPLKDDSFSNLDGKLYAMWRFWQNDIPVPRTAFGPTDFLVDFLDDIGGVGVLKSVNGTKGNDNYLVKTADEIRKIVNDNPEVDFTLQNFIENDGDYRVIVVDFEPKMIIYRSANGRDFRNNTSLGGEATLIELDKVNPEVIDLAVKAAKALNIKIAGADILEDKNTGKLCVLEVNRTPQLATGAFQEEKLDVLRNLVHS